MLDFEEVYVLFLWVCIIVNLIRFDMIKFLENNFSISILEDGLERSRDWS